MGNIFAEMLTNINITYTGVERELERLCCVLNRS